MPLAAGERLGPYEILAPIGAGGMGEVYRARDSRLNREVAIKVSKEQFSERFEREARAVAALNHPNICHLYDIVTSLDGPGYLVMELIEGESPKGPLPPGEVIRIADQLASALEAAHEKGIVHRDLKPANIKITPDGTVKVLDFGLAKVGSVTAPTEDSPTFTMGTQAGMILGTAAYMSPEQARGKFVDKRADIWAFGVIVYELLTGDRMHKGESVPDTLASVLREEPKLEKVPPRFRTLLQRCLEKDSKKRLRDIGDAIPLVATQEGGEAAPPSTRRTALPWVIAAVSAVAFLVLAAIHLRESPPVPPAAARFQIRLPEGVHFTSTGSMTLSPDGRHVAFSASAPNQPAAVWVQDLDAIEARAIPGTYTSGAVPPFFWSPDSRYIVYSENSAKLKKADLQTGALQDICDKPGPPIGGSWNKDGLIIFGSNSTGLWKVPSSGGQPTPLTTLDPSRHEREHELPSFLPDGRHFLYLRASSMPEESGIFAGSIDDPPDKQSKKRILATGFGASYVPASDGGRGWLLFLRDNNLVAQRFDPDRLELSGEPSAVVEGVGSVYESGYFSPSPSALIYRASNSIRDYQLTWFDRQGKPVGTVGEPGPVSAPWVSPDGKLAAYSKASATAEVWIVDLKSGTQTRFTFGPQPATYPVFSPDGKEVVFSKRNEYWDLYRKPTNGSREEEPLLVSKVNKRPMDWSRDGRFLFFTSSDSTAFSREDIWVLPMQGDGKPQPLLNMPFDESAAALSPDGRWLAYHSTEGDHYQVYVRDFISSSGTLGSGKWMVSKDIGRAPIWRNDSRELVYYDGGSIVSVSLEPGPVFRAGPPRQLFRYPANGTALAATPDLSRFLIAVGATARGPQYFNVMLNWTSVLKQR